MMFSVLLYCHYASIKNQIIKSILFFTLIYPYFGHIDYHINRGTLELNFLHLNFEAILSWLEKQRRTASNGNTVSLKGIAYLYSEQIESALDSFTFSEHFRFASPCYVSRGAYWNYTDPLPCRESLYMAFDRPHPTRSTHGLDTNLANIRNFVLARIG